jgi:viroplasmin and RNaseH domain-containing protein
MLKEVLDFLGDNRIRTIEISRYLGTEHFIPITKVKTTRTKKPLTTQEYEDLLNGIKDPNVVEEIIHVFETSNDDVDFIKKLNACENEIVKENQNKG